MSEPNFTSLHPVVVVDIFQSGLNRQVCQDGSYIFLKRWFLDKSKARDKQAFQMRESDGGHKFQGFKEAMSHVIAHNYLLC